MKIKEMPNNKVDSIIRDYDVFFRIKHLLYVRNNRASVVFESQSIHIYIDTEYYDTQRNIG